MLPTLGLSVFHVPLTVIFNFSFSDCAPRIEILGPDNNSREETLE